MEGIPRFWSSDARSPTALLALPCTVVFCAQVRVHDLRAVGSPSHWSGWAESRRAYQPNKDAQDTPRKLNRGLTIPM